MQQWPLERKIQVTQTRILEFGLKLDNKVCISFSGGKDSTVLLDMARRVFPDIEAVFFDTGLEFPEVRAFVETVDNVKWIRPKMNFRKVIETYGYPIISKHIAGYIASARNNPDSTRAKYLRGDIPSKCFGFSGGKYYYLVDAPFKCSEYCCTVMKKQPMHRYFKDTGNHPIIGTMASESMIRRNQWLKNGCNIMSGKTPMSKPMSFWTEQDVLEYIKRFDIQYASVYGEIVQDEGGKYHTTGYNRTGCVFCGFGSHLEKEPNRFQRLKESHPPCGITA